MVGLFGGLAGRITGRLSWRMVGGLFGGLAFLVCRFRSVFKAFNWMWLMSDGVARFR